MRELAIQNANIAAIRNAEKVRVVIGGPKNEVRYVSKTEVKALVEQYNLDPSCLSS